MNMPKTILVVDDKASVRTLVKDYLTEENFKVVIAENGQQALYAARQEKPDLVLLDIMMPNMDGLEACRRIKADPRTRHIPVVMLSSADEIDTVVQCIKLGADDFIRKPFSQRLLVERVKALAKAIEGLAGRRCKDLPQAKRPAALAHEPACGLGLGEDDAVIKRRIRQKYQVMSEERLAAEWWRGRGGRYRPPAPGARQGRPGYRDCWRAGSRQCKASRRAYRR